MLHVKRRDKIRETPANLNFCIIKFTNFVKHSQKWRCPESFFRSRLGAVMIFELKFAKASHFNWKIRIFPEASWNRWCEIAKSIVKSRRRYLKNITASTRNRVSQKRRTVVKNGRKLLNVLCFLDIDLWIPVTVAEVIANLRMFRKFSRETFRESGLETMLWYQFRVHFGVKV